MKPYKVSYAKPLADVVRICDTDLKVFARSRTHDELVKLFMECFGECVIKGEDSEADIRIALARYYAGAPVYDVKPSEADLKAFADADRRGVAGC